MLKYAECQVLGICKGGLGCTQMAYCPTMRHMADNIHKFAQVAPATRKIIPYDKDYRFIRTKSIGNLEVDGPNNNNDSFPYEHFEDDRPNYGYRSFIDKKAFQEHQSDMVENSIGYLPAAYLNAFNLDRFGGEGVKYGSLGSAERIYILNLPNQRDGSIEVLMAIDATRAPRIARQIEKNEPIAVSMGCNIDHSVCSTCGNIAHFEHEYCACLKYSRGAIKFVPADTFRTLLKDGSMRLEWLPWVFSDSNDINTILNSTSNRVVSALNFEINHILSFFELSIVANPAYYKGYQLEKIAGYREMVDLLKVCDRIDWSSMSSSEILGFEYLIKSGQLNVV